MKFPHIAEASIEIEAKRSRVWEALTKPELVKQYFFGVELVTDWHEGHPIIYKGEWDGRTFEEKGVVLRFIPEVLIVSTYRSSASILPDEPENYNVVTYKLEESKGKTKVTVTQENIESQESADHSKKNWEGVLEGLKKLLESKF